VAIHLPKNWRAAWTPRLTREGDTLKGGFADLPADAIALTLQAPEGWAFWAVTYVGTVLVGLAWLVGASLCWSGGRSKGRSLARQAKPRPSWIERHAWPRSLGLGALYGLAVLGTGVFAVFGPDWVLPAGQASDRAYRDPFFMLEKILLMVFLVSVLVVPFGFVIAQSTAIIVRYRAAAKAVEVPIPTASQEQ